MCAQSCLPRMLAQVTLVLWARLAAVLAYDILRQDPNPIIYPGQVNIGLLADIHGPGANGSYCGSLNQGAVQQAMAAVWAAHQVNFRKDPHELNIGVYIYDTCSREDVAQRQLYRLLGHVGHVQSASCVEKKTPPVFGVLTQGSSEALRIPSRMLEAFSVPTIGTWGDEVHRMFNYSNVLTTAPTTSALARATVNALGRFGYSEIAVISQDSLWELYADLKNEAGIAGMLLTKVHHPSIAGNEELFADSLKDVNGSRQAPVKALVFLLDTEQGLELLKAVGSRTAPQLPWIVVTPADISRKLQSTLATSYLLHLRKVLLISPVQTQIPEFHVYFKQLLKEETVMYHPLLVEFLRSVNGSYASDLPTGRQFARFSVRTSRRRSRRENATELIFKQEDVAPTVKGVWALSAALKAVQKKSCRRGTDCLLYLRRVLSSYVLKATKLLDYSFRGTGIISLEGSSLKFKDDGSLATVRFGLSAVSTTGEFQRVGWYSDETGLMLDLIVLSTTAGFDSHTAVTLGPSYRNQHETPTSNFRSVSLTSHDEDPRSGDSPPPVPIRLQPIKVSMTDVRGPDQLSAAKQNVVEDDPLPTPDDHVISVRHTSLAEWMGRPWALAILGISGFGVLATLYILVFLLVKSCEGALRKGNPALIACQLLSLLALYGSATLFTWKPSAKLCGLQRFIPNVSLAFCFGCLLLKGMHLRSQGTIGLGGSVSRFNQVLTLFFIVGVQVALEVQWWILRPPEIVIKTNTCAIPKEDILSSQLYVVILLVVAVLVSFTVRKLPYNCREGKSLVATGLTCFAFFAAWGAACWLLPDADSRNIAAPVTLIIIAIVVLIGVFAPQLYVIHKYGGFPHKPLSYADSLSTVFTMFKDMDNASGVGSTGRRGKKSAKTLDTHFRANDPPEGTRNPLYSDFASAYP